jgi:hypothetical protein
MSAGLNFGAGMTYPTADHHAIDGIRRNTLTDPEWLARGYVWLEEDDDDE